MSAQPTTWREAAEDLLVRLQGYEDAHPTGEPCFRLALEEVERRYAQVYAGEAS